MKCMFSECYSLSLLPDISKWNISNIKFMGGMFSNCISLLFIPDISKLDIKKTNDMFKGCISLSHLPDLSGKSKKNKNNNKLFDNDCLSCINIPTVV